MSNYTGNETPRNKAIFDHDPTRLILTSPAQLNSICEDCIICGTSCEGTTEQAWTGCAAKPWSPSPQSDFFGVESRHGIHPAGLAQAVQLTRTASQERHISLFYSETADAIKAQIRKPGDRLNVPSTYLYITTTAHPLTALDIAREIDTALDLAQGLPF